MDEAIIGRINQLTNYSPPPVPNDENTMTETKIRRIVNEEIDKRVVKPPANNVWEEFEKVCRPVVEFLQKRYGSPHHRVLIDWSSAVLLEDLKGVGFKEPD